MARHRHSAANLAQCEPFRQSRYAPWGLQGAYRPTPDDVGSPDGHVRTRCPQNRSVSVTKALRSAENTEALISVGCVSAVSSRAEG